MEVPTRLIVYNISESSYYDTVVIIYIILSRKRHADWLHLFHSCESSEP